MAKILFLHEHAEFGTLVRALSGKLSVPLQFVEKDYWLMHCLWALQDQNLKFELKGGTSLSKGWHLINRFSEDVDIKIFPPEGMTVTGGKNHTKPRHRANRAEYFEWLKDTLRIPGASYLKRDHAFDDRDLRNAGFRIGYSSHFDELPALKNDVLLEVGFDVTTPNERKDISSWAYDLAKETNIDTLDNRALSVPCYRPEYTLVEKLNAITRKYRQEQEGKLMPINFIRHYYDVYQLLGEESIVGFIGTQAYSEHKASRLRKTEEIDLGKNQALILSDPETRERYAREYQRTQALYYGEVPSFDSILARIREHLAKL